MSNLNNFPMFNKKTILTILMYYGTEYVLQVVLIFNPLNAKPEKWSK